MATSSGTKPGRSGGAGYSAPALEKGLDILELLAGRGAAGLTQKRIAERLDRSASEIFRMLVVLQQRGYVRRRSPAETYHLTARLFELAHRHPPVRDLLEAALPVMRMVARRTRQSCHLVVCDGADALVVAKAASPEPMSFSVRVGVRVPLADAASGRVLLAFGTDAGRATPGLDAIRRRGFERHRSRVTRGIIDLSCPVLDHHGNALAAITVPFLTQRGNHRDAVDEAMEVLTAAAAGLSESVGGSTAPFGQPVEEHAT